MSSAISTQLRFKPVPASGSVGRVKAQGVDWLVVIVLAAHVPLAILLSFSTILSTLHGVLTVAVGLFVAVQSRKHPERVAYAGAYMVGAEVLWRMTGSLLFWEVGKYATAGVFLLSIALNPRRKLSAWPLVYFALLIPSTVLTMTLANSAVLLQKELSFYLSGPLALAAAWCFFAQLKLSTKQMQRVFLSLLSPTLGVAAVAMFGTLTTRNLAFTDESNFATSGGFGPNQVSGALALGLVCALVWLLASKDGLINKGIIFAVVAFLGIQTALTFSRGGLYNAAGSAAIAIYYLMRDRRSRLRVIAAVGVILLVAIFIVAPRLDTFTEGAISTRFKDLNLANRDNIIMSDLALWQANPVLGVGPGRAAIGRPMPHTEVSRLLAEHGLFGLMALITLLISALRAIRQARTNAGKAVAGSMVTFSLLFMLDKAMRLVAPSFAFGLAFATLMPDEMDAKREPKRSNELERRPNVRGSWRRRPAARVRPRTSQQTEPSTQLCLQGSNRPGGPNAISRSS